MKTRATTFLQLQADREQGLRQTNTQHAIIKEFFESIVFLRAHLEQAVTNSDREDYEEKIAMKQAELEMLGDAFHEHLRGTYARLTDFSLPPQVLGDPFSRACALLLEWQRLAMECLEVEKNLLVRGCA